MANRIWADAWAKKQDALRRADARLATKITSPELFEASLDEIARRYTNKNVTILTKEILGPHLEHIASFSHAISSAVQGAPLGAAIWGGLLIVIESGCRFSRSLEEILAEVAELQASLPEFSEYIDLYDNPGLQMCLRDLFEDYIDYCLCIVKYTSRSPAFHILRNIVSSSHVKGLQHIKASIERNKKRFAQRAEMASRQNAERHYSESQKLQGALAQGLTSLHATLASSEPPQSPAAAASCFGRSLSHSPPMSSKTLTSQFIHTVQWKRNPLFLGRDEELTLLHKYLTAPRQSGEPVSCAVHGIGGVGKTQLALEYTYKHRVSYDAIFWIRTQTSVVLLESVAVIGNKLGIPGEASDGRRSSKILDWLETTDKRWLLIMDNLEDIETVATVWPINSNGAGAIIVTTQKPCDVFHWTDYEIPLKPFPAEVGSEFLLRRLGDGIDAGGGERALIAQQISSNVGGLPLWLNALGGFITVSQCSLAECVDIFRSTLDPMDEGVLAGGCTYEKSPSAVFDLAFSKLTPDAKTLLCLLAFLDPDGVPESMLLVDNPGENLGVLDSAKRHRFFSAIANLRSSQLVKREGSDSDSDSCLTTHRSVQTAMLRKLDQDLEQRRMSFRDACFLIRRVFPRPSPLQQPEPDKWPLIQTYLPQLLSLEKAFRQTQPPIEGSTELAILLSDVGLNAWDRGLGHDAKNLLQTAEAVLDSIGCDEWAMERSDIHVLLGIMTDTTGITQRAEGLRYRESAHRIRKRHIESIPPEKRTLEDEIRYYNTLTDLGCSYQHLNRHDEVAQICEEVLAKYRSWGTEEQFPYEFAKYYRHMSFVLVRRGDVQKAVEYSRQAIKLLELGNFGLLAASNKADCATMLYFNGEISEAVCQHQEVLQHRLQTLGRSNIMTIHSYLALGAICYFTDDMDNAEMYIREAVTQCRKSVPPREVALKARYYLYLVLAKQKKRDTDVNLGKWAEEIKAGLQELLVLDESGFSRDKNIMDPVVFDYLIPWIYRTTVN